MVLLDAHTRVEALTIESRIISPAVNIAPTTASTRYAMIYKNVVNYMYV